MSQPYSADQWISCETELPPLDTCCLICTKNGDTEIGALKNSRLGSYWSFGCGHTSYSEKYTGGIPFDYVEYWMPLPEPYKENEHE